MASPQIKYNPGLLSDAELIESFVVRKESLDLVLEALRENATSAGANRHLLIVGPRGSGKTMLVRRVAAEIARNPEYGSHWHAVVFGEEPYQVGTPGEFWLEALFHLASQTGEARWGRALEDLRRELDEQRLRERALGQLLDFSAEQGKRLLLVVENLNMLCQQITPDAAWDLRHTLANEPRIMLLGTATSRFDEVTEVGRAWFEMFSIHELQPLMQGECTTLWQSVTKEPLVPRRAPVIRILTGGNPRLVTILASFAANRSFRDLMEQLVHLLDDHTEYFKGHLDALGPQERRVFAAVLDRWDPVSAADVAELARVSVNEASTLLGRLVARGAVEIVEQKKRRKVYQAAERLYNLYYLMRRRGRPEARVHLAVRFMVTFYRGEELVSRIRELAEEGCCLPEGTREDHYLAYRAALEHVWSLAPRIVERTPREFFEACEAPAFIRELPEVARSEKARKLMDEAHRHFRALRLEEAEQACLKVIEFEPEVALIWSILGLLLLMRGRGQEARRAWDRALEIDPKHWVSVVGLLSVQLVTGVEADAVLQEARERVERSDRDAGVLREVARSIPRLGLARGLPLAEEWAREACSKEPGWRSAEALAWVLAAQGRWEEALATCRPVLDAAPRKKDAQAAATDLLIRAGAAGQARQALETLMASQGAAAMEPLAVGLRIFLGESVLVAKEILEIGQDVAERIRAVAAGRGSAAGE